MIRRIFVERYVEERPKRKAVGAPPSDASLRADAFKVPDQQYAEVDARRNARPAVGVVIIRFAKCFDERVESGLSQQQIEFAIKHMAFGSRQIGGCDPKVLLSFVFVASQCHFGFSSLLSPRQTRLSQRHSNVAPAARLGKAAFRDFFNGLLGRRTVPITTQKNAARRR